jgi:hypothetical protein
MGGGAPMGTVVILATPMTVQPRPGAKPTREQVIGGAGAGPIMTGIVLTTPLQHMSRSTTAPLAGAIQLLMSTPRQPGAHGWAFTVVWFVTSIIPRTARTAHSPRDFDTNDR